MGTTKTRIIQKQGLWQCQLLVLFFQLSPYMSSWHVARIARLPGTALQNMFKNTHAFGGPVKLSHWRSRNLRPRATFGFGYDIKGPAISTLYECIVVTKYRVLIALRGSPVLRGTKRKGPSVATT